MKKSIAILFFLLLMSGTGYCQIAEQRTIYVEDLKYYNPHGTYDLSGDYIHHGPGKPAYANGRPILYRAGIVYVNLSYFGSGMCEVQFYLRWQDRFNNGYYAWYVIGDIVWSSVGNEGTAGDFTSLDSGFDDYYPKCGTFGGVTISGDVCDPYANANVPEAYSHLGFEYFLDGTANGKNQYQRTAASPSVPDEHDVATIFFDGVQWIWQVVPAVPSNARTMADPVILSTAGSTAGENPPCSGWTNGFSLSGSICENDLPVNLVSFTGKVTEEGRVQLLWSTASESNSARFDIEHSPNGREWRRVGSVDAHGESEKLIHYNYIHTIPTRGNSYYRLAQTDRDGTFTYSRIVIVRLAAGTFSVYPNPAAHRAYVTNPEDLAAVEVVDANGRVVIRQTEGIAQGILLKELAPGMLFFRTEDKSGHKQTVKVLLRP